MKLCTKCGIEKPLNEFHKNKKSDDGLSYWCRMCKSEQNLLPKAKRKREKYDLERRYGILPKQKQQMIEKQNGKCAICKKELDSGRETNIDHDHETGRIRGILCNNCNIGLGYLERGGGFSRGRIMEYLLKYEEKLIQLRLLEG